MLWLIMHRMMNRCFLSPLRSQQVGKGTHCSTKDVTVFLQLSVHLCHLLNPNLSGNRVKILHFWQVPEVIQRGSTDFTYIYSAHKVKQNEDCSRSWELNLWSEVVIRNDEENSNF